MTQVQAGQIEVASNVENDAKIEYLEYVRSSKKKLDRFHIFGERRCGTNYVRTLILNNFQLKPTRAYGWKHSIPQFPILPQRCLFVVVVRDPYTWASSFFNGAYEAHPFVAKRSFDDFIRKEWIGQYRPARSPWDKCGYTIDRSVGRGEELQLDRHPITGERFKTIFEMRSVKNQSYLGLLNRNVNVVALRFEDALAHPQELCASISKHFDLEHECFAPVEKVMGPKGLKKTEKRVHELTDDQRDFITSQLDPQLEKRFKYLT